MTRFAHYLDVLCVVALAFAAGCGSGITSGSLVTNQSASRCAAWGQPDPRVVLEEPKEAHVEVGLIEVRTTRPKAIDVLLEELVYQGRIICADALVPAKADEARQAQIAAGAGPYRAFYVFDNGTAQVLEARAIRFTRNIER